MGATVMDGCMIDEGGVLGAGEVLRLLGIRGGVHPLGG
jgi:carbonic anhydrase/acetyltransferase-like protein (isoleucine patch superfamily)